MLQFLNWRSGNALHLGESEGKWVADIHLAIDRPPAAENLITQKSGRWKGGGVIILSDSQSTILAVRQNDRYQVSFIDLVTGDKNILVESQDVPPFLSIAPEHGLTAVSIPATEETVASLRVFSMTNRLDVGQPLGETPSAKAVLSPDGNHLLYTVTVSRSNIMQVTTDTSVTTNTEIITNTSVTSGSQIINSDTETTTASNTLTTTQTITRSQPVTGAQIETTSQTMEDTQTLTDTSRANGDRLADAGGAVEVETTTITHIITTTEVTTETQQFFHATFYLSNLADGSDSIAYEFDHGLIEYLDNYLYDFTPNGQAIVYQNDSQELYRMGLDGQNMTKIFTPDNPLSEIHWQISPGSDYVVILLVGLTEQNTSDLSIVSLETGKSIMDDTLPKTYQNTLTFLDPEQILFSPSPDKQSVYKFTSNYVDKFDKQPSPSILAEDRGLVAFVRKNGINTRFEFFNPFYSDLASNLAFDLSEDFQGSSIQIFDLAGSYVVFTNGSALYYKDILSNGLPILLASNQGEYRSAKFTPDLSAVLYTVNSKGQDNIYRLDLGNEKGIRLLENAGFLDKLERIWLSPELLKP
ncbi:MAG: hypothetical protein KDJ52_08005 [Anaerolineae bacterium]|nr:hypothetical protein [Anaerolineae bacterium]